MLPRPVTVEDEAKDGLSRQRWVFVIERAYLILQRYYFEERPAPGAPYKVTRFYERGSERGYGDWMWLSVEEVPWDDDVKGDALAELVRHILVIREGDKPV